MCGIIACISDEECWNILYNGLLQLKNRGYDSAGICLIKNDKFEVNKYASTNKINALDKLVSLNLNSTNTVCGIAIGHNRWATHGIKNDTNAHPHLSNDNKFVIVHNGIIENYNELKQMLIQNGYIFKSPPADTSDAFCNNFSCPTVGGLNLPNTIVSCFSFSGSGADSSSFLFFGIDLSCGADGFVTCDCDSFDLTGANSAFSGDGDFFLTISRSPFTVWATSLPPLSTQPP
jgi:hypothetical protein